MWNIKEDIAEETNERTKGRTRNYVIYVPNNRKKSKKYMFCTHNNDNAVTIETARG